MSDPKIALGWIRSDMVDGAFQDAVDNFLTFDSENRRITQGRGFRKGLYLDELRDDLANEFLTKTTADYLMSVDTDMEWRPEQIYHLLDEAEANDRQMIGGLYFSFMAEKSYPQPVWFSDITKGGALTIFHSFVPGELIVPLAGMGMGFTLIRRDVFEIMARQPVKPGWKWFGRDVYMWNGEYRNHGEDVCFCVRAGDCGIKMWGHKGVVVRHWKKVPVDFRMFRAFVELARQEGAQI